MTEGGKSRQGAERAREAQTDTVDSADTEQNLEEALEDSFPASDPPAENRFD